MKFTKETFDSVLRGAYSTRTLDDGALYASRFTEEQCRVIGERVPTVPYHGASMRLDFYTDAEGMSMEFRYLRHTSRIFLSIDVYEDGVMTYSYLEKNALDAKRGAFDFTFEKKGRKRVTVWLPYTTDLAYERIELAGESYVEPYTDYAGYILMMGDSITHGYDAEMTSQSYASTVMRRLDLDGMNQGVGGYTFHRESLDPALFEGKKLPDIITIAYGTNDWSGKTNENFTRDIDEFFVRLRELYPDVPVLVITPVFRASHYIPSKTGTFEYAREYLTAAAKKYPNTYVLDGDKLVPHVYDFFRDVRLHPNDAGFVTYGASVADAVAEILGIRPKSFFI